MPSEVAPGVHRLGNELVNFYLVEGDGGLTLVDAGLSGFTGQLEAFMRGRGQTLANLDAVVLTHAHPDHVGVAETVRAAGATVHVHEADALMARTAKAPKRERSLLPYLRHRAAWQTLGVIARAGGIKPVKIAEVSPFAGDDPLDVPGRPRPIHTPGHSSGHVALHFADRGVLMTGDALCTWNPLTGRPGPQVMPAGLALSAAAEMQSLARLEGVEAGLLLPGHGDPWAEGIAAAVARAREAGAS
jgi:glyoxylase-like metal-dependent hydrolase (beta-lactamase superfamily II)